MNTKTITRCEFCGEQLTDPESITRGIGPVCAKKQTAAFDSVGTTAHEMAQIAVMNERDARVINRALAKGAKRDVEFAKFVLGRVRCDVRALGDEPALLADVMSERRAA